MIEINQLHVSVDETPILKGVDLQINPGEVHAIMGPNGSGKSTLSAVLAGDPTYTVTQGSVRFKGEDLLALSVDKRAQLGVFLGFQYPVEIPGVNNMLFLKTAFNNLRKARGEAELDAFDFLALVKEKAAFMEMDGKYLKRSLNEGFSGGEKKRNEILHMMVLNPDLMILDEIDSGLDIDALQIVSKGINQQRAENKAILMVTHYQRLLDYVVPDVVHVMADGKIVKTGDKSLALSLEEKGYAWLL